MERCVQGGVRLALAALSAIGKQTLTWLLENWIAADILRTADGVLAGHWDMIQREAMSQTSKGGFSSPHSGSEISKTEYRFVSLNTWHTVWEGSTSLR
jgi:hypothetical protein